MPPATRQPATTTALLVPAALAGSGTFEPLYPPVHQDGGRFARRHGRRNFGSRRPATLRIPPSAFLATDHSERMGALHPRSRSRLKCMCPRAQQAIWIWVRSSRSSARSTRTRRATPLPSVAFNHRPREPRRREREPRVRHLRDSGPSAPAVNTTSARSLPARRLPSRLDPAWRRSAS